MYKLSGIFIILLISGLYNLVTAQDQEAKPAFQYFNKTETGIGLGFGSYGTDEILGYVKKVKNGRFYPVLPISFMT